MKHEKRQRLERAGWTIGGAADFLGLKTQETRFIELKLALATGVKRLRERQGLTQASLAHQLGSSQSRIAKMEAGDPTVSIDLVIRTLLALGASKRDLATLIGGAASSRAA